jgi:hypothetical protein
MQRVIEQETVSVIELALQGQSELLQSLGFVPIRVYTDLQSAFSSLMTQFKGVVNDVGGAQDYVLFVDVKISRIKEVYRGINQ